MSNRDFTSAIQVYRYSDIDHTQDETLVYSEVIVDERDKTTSSMSVVYAEVFLDTDTYFAIAKNINIKFIDNTAPQGINYYVIKIGYQATGVQDYAIYNLSVNTTGKLYVKELEMEDSGA
jgi:hypothetical protein